MYCSDFQLNEGIYNFNLGILWISDSNDPWSVGIGFINDDPH